MMNKKASTLTSTVYTILIAMGLFFGLYNYVNYNYQNAGLSINNGYNDSYADLQLSMGNLNNSVEGIKSAGQSITQADAGVALIAWNGLTGLAQTIRVMFDLLDVAINVFNAIFPALAFIPTWLKVLVEIGIIATLAFLIIGLFKGEQRT